MSRTAHLLLCVLTATVVDLVPESRCFAAAQDAEAPAGEAAEALPAETDVTVESEGEEKKTEGSTEDAQAYLDSAGELKDKLAQLQELIAARGDKGDPDLNSKLEGLSKQLEGLGLDSLTGGGLAPGSNKELSQFLMGCVVMAVRKVGLQRSSTVGALKKASEGKMELAEAATTEVWKLVGVCVNDLTDEELAQYKRGDMKDLPRSFVQAAEQEDAAAKVTSMDASVWKELQLIAGTVVSDLAGNKEKPPIMIGAIFAVPLLLGFAFLGKKFMDMQNRSAKKDKPDKKKQK